MDSKTIIVEYLIITKQEDTFCNSAESFVKFLGVDSSLTITEHEIEIKLTKASKNNINNKFKVSYSLSSDLVPHKNQRYFKLKLSSKQTDKLNEYTELTKTLESIISRLNQDVSINILWNDIGREYAILGYSLINKVENLLRRLIADFMLINVGYSWAEDHIPIEVISRDESRKPNNYTDYLYQTYFSGLKTILFQGQRDVNFRNIGDVQRIIERKLSNGEKVISIDELNGVIAKSLWEKYFSNEINEKKETIEVDLDKLNNLRNEIAHNRHISRETLGKIESLSDKIIRTLNLAIQDLPNKNLTVEEIEFQTYTEYTRVGESSSMNALGKDSLIAIIAKWYSNKYGLADMSFFDGFKVGFDIIWNSNERDSIAIQVKEYEKFTPMHLEELVKNIVNFIQEKRVFLSQFNQFHFVVIYKQIVGVPSGLIPEVRRKVLQANPTTALIIGFINEEGSFRALS